jgi:hypothetical protein
VPDRLAQNSSGSGVRESSAEIVLAWGIHIIGLPPALFVDDPVAHHARDGGNVCMIEFPAAQATSLN